MTHPSESHVHIPVIETERLRLRGHRLEDFEQSAALWGDPVVTRHIGGRPLTREEVWARLLRYIGHWALLGFGFWAVEEMASGEFIGEMGFAYFEREIAPPLPKVPEMGWILAPRAHGKGYATEAVRAALAWGDVRFHASPFVCLIDSGNVASRRVAEKCGFRELFPANYKGEQTVVFKR